MRAHRFSPRRSMAQKAALLPTGAELRADDAQRECWAERKFSDALTVYRTIFGSKVLHTRLQKAIADEAWLVADDEARG
jgi:hypothetical protein